MKKTRGFGKIEIIVCFVCYWFLEGFALQDIAFYEYGPREIDCCKKIKDLYFDFYKKDKPLVFIKTYGCQQNVSDSEKYAGMLEKMGFQITENKDIADAVLFNTCAIRENAENKAFGNLGWIKNIKNNNPDLFVILCGCMTEQPLVLERIKNKYFFVDLVFGTHSLHKFPELFYDVLIKRTQKEKNRSGIYISEKIDNISENIPIKRGNSLKAFVSIMYGCNNFCSYCIVPYVRGRERSRSPSEVIKEFKNLVEAGYKDITLLGQNVNSYGKDFGENIDFADLLKELDRIPGDCKIRFMTSHPKDASKKLFDTIAESKHIVHHVHLPVQCGSNRILKEMNRKYTKEDYYKIINYAKSKIPDITFTSDIIVGFPGETYEEFLETLELIKKVKFSSLFTFIYSKREGTKAAGMEDNIPKEEKTKWLLELLNVQKEISENLCKDMVGTTQRVLAESCDEKRSCVFCRTDGNLMVEISGENKMLVGSFLNVKIVDCRTETLIGKII